MYPNKKEVQMQADLLRKKLAHYSLQKNDEQSKIISENPSALINSLAQEEQHFNSEIDFST